MLDGGEAAARPASLRGLIEDVAGEMVPAERLRLEVDALPIEANIGDGAAMAVALRALLDNAVRYTGHARVSVIGDADELQARVVIRDEGPGIPVDDRSRVHERFFRGNNSVGIEGAGIGLPVAQRLVASLGGTLTVEPRTDGTDVVVVVPVSSAAQGTAAADMLGSGR